MANETWKIAHLVGTSAQGAAGGGRKGLLMHDTNAATLRMQLDSGGSYAFYARRDVAQTFTGLQTFQGGVVAATAKVSNLTQGRVVTVGVNGALVDDSGLTRNQSNGITSILRVGDGSMNSSSASVYLNGFSGSSYPGIAFQSMGVTRAIFRWENAADAIAISMRGTLEEEVDSPLRISRALGGRIDLGGSAATKRDVNCTNNFLIAFIQRISSAGRFDASSLYNSAWAGGGIRPLLTDSAGMGYATDANTFRSAIGAAAAGGVRTISKQYNDNLSTTEALLMQLDTGAPGTSDASSRFEFRAYNASTGTMTFRLTLPGSTTDETITLANGGNLIIRISVSAVSGNWGNVSGIEVNNNGATSIITSTASFGTASKTINIYGKASLATATLWSHASCVTTKTA